MLNILVLKITNGRRNRWKERIIIVWKHFDIKGLQYVFCLLFIVAH